MIERRVNRVNIVESSSLRLHPRGLPWPRAARLLQAGGQKEGERPGFEKRIEPQGVPSESGEEPPGFLSKQMVKLLTTLAGAAPPSPAELTELQ